MITPFYGELFIMPLPLEVSHNYCSHKCSYCFANLNNPGRQVDVKKLFNQISNFEGHKSYASELMRQKRVVCVSNKTDPFATSNYKISVPMLEMLTGNDIPICIQSRGGKGLDDALTFLKPTVFYVSVCQTDENMRKLVEPGGTSLGARWDMIDKLQGLGHKIVVAVNPFFSKWIDPEIMTERLLRHKVTHVIVQDIHLDYKQERAMSDKERDALKDVLPIAKKMKIDSGEETALNDFIDILIAAGIDVYEPGRVMRSNFMDIYHSTFPGATFKTYYDFAQWCYGNKGNDDEVYFREFWDFMKDSLPAGKMRVYNYLTSINEKFRNQKEFFLPAELTFKDIAKVMWNDLSIKRHPGAMDNFAVLAEDCGTEDVLIKDKYDNNIFVWNAQGQQYVNTYFSNQL